MFAGNISSTVLEFVGLQILRKQPVRQKQSLADVLRSKSSWKFLKKFTAKHLYRSLFFNKVAGLLLATLLKKRIWHSCVPMNFAKFLRTTFFKKPVQWLFLVRDVSTTTSKPFLFHIIYWPKYSRKCHHFRSIALIVLYVS